MLPNIYSKQILDVIFLSLLVIVYNNVCKHFENEDNLEKAVDGAHADIIVDSSFFSSVWCQGSNHTDRQCRFTNLCYSSKEKEFMFFKSHQSIISGVPSNMFDPALAELSSVNNHNKMFFNYVEYPFDVFSKFQASTIQGCVIIVKRFNPENLMHVFHDDLLPIFFKTKELALHFSSSFCKTPTLVFADDRPPGPHSRLYKGVLKTEPIYLTDIDNNVCFQNSFIGLNKQTTWYQYGFKIPQGSLIKKFDGMANIIHQFTEHLRHRFKIPLQQKHEDCAVMLVRKKNRKILNERQLAEAIKQNLYNQVYVLGLESHGIIEIIEYISKCKYVIGIHGSLLILSMFLLPGSSLIELFPYAISPKHFTPYKTLTSFPGIGVFYYSWENKNKANSRQHPENIPDLGGIKHLPIERQNYIKTLSFVHPPLCCGNPEWLYHIYQDTIVNISSFTKVIKSARKKSEVFIETEYRKSEVERLQKSIRPSAVNNLVCSKHGLSTFTITWSVPSNLLFINYTKLEYEIWLQLSGQDDVSAYITAKSFFKLKETQDMFYIWVRCLIEGDNYGPFNDDGFLCFPDIHRL